MQKFADGLDIEIQIFDFATKQIYRSTENPIKLYLLKSENHYDVISNIECFLCENDDHHKAEKRRCKACNSESKCDTQECSQECEKCSKLFYGKQCLDNHIRNQKCIEYSYICKTCRDIIKLAI